MKDKLLIGFEGLDGAGKSSIVKGFTNLLSQHNISHGFIHFPNDESYFGKIIYDKLNSKREIADDIFQSIYILDMLNNQQRIKTLMEQNDVTILDRYFYSTLAYSNYYGTEDIIKSLTDQLIQPDMVFYLSVPLDTITKRLRLANRSDAHESNNGLLIKAFEGYEKLSLSENFVTIDASRSIELILKDVADNYFYLVNRKMGTKLPYSDSTRYLNMAGDTKIHPHCRPM